MAEIERYYAYQTLFSSRKAVPKMEFLLSLIHISEPTRH